jgi:TonB family protein
MKKREITNNDLEQIFNNIIEQAPLINEEQVKLLLNTRSKVTPGNSTKHFFQNHLNKLIIGTIVLSVAAGLSLWVNSGRNTEKTIQNNWRENEAVPTSTDTIAIKPAVKNDKELPDNTIQEDKTATISSNKAGSSPVQSVKEIPVSDIYDHFAKQPQIFSFQANRDTSITCKEGTLIKIKSNSFISAKTGKEISGKVQVAVSEYYKISDILLSSLSSTSDNKILETGGMIHLSASADSEKCIIKEGSVIEIGFPYSNKKNDMALFNGEWTNNKIDWKLANANRSVKEIVEEKSAVGQVYFDRGTDDQVFTVVEAMPEFPGGDRELRRYINQNAKYPFSMLKNKIEGKVIVTFVIDRFGYLNNIRVVKGMDSILDKVAVYLVSKMPAWKPARQGGRAISCRYTVPVEFVHKDSVLTDDEIQQSKVLEEKIKDLKINPATRSYITNNKAFNEEIEKRIKEGNFQETNALDVNHYIFSVSQLGWINCDRFDNDKNPKTNYSILIDEPNKTIVNVIFHRIKAIVPGCIESNRITFKNVPLGEMITIVAVKMVNSKLFLAVKETEITDKEETELDFQPVTVKLLKKEMEKLNKLN